MKMNMSRAIAIILTIAMLFSMPPLGMARAAGQRYTSENMSGPAPSGNSGSEGEGRLTPKPTETPDSLPNKENAAERVDDVIGETNDTDAEGNHGEVDPETGDLYLSFSSSDPTPRTTSGPDAAAAPAETIYIQETEGVPALVSEEGKWMRAEGDNGEIEWKIVLEPGAGAPKAVRLVETFTPGDREVGGCRTQQLKSGSIKVKTAGGQDVPFSIKSSAPTGGFAIEIQPFAERVTVTCRATWCDPMAFMRQQYMNTDVCFQNTAQLFDETGTTPYGGPQSAVVSAGHGQIIYKSLVGAGTEGGSSYLDWRLEIFHHRYGADTRYTLPDVQIVDDLPAGLTVSGVTVRGAALSAGTGANQYTQNGNRLTLFLPAGTFKNTENTYITIKTTVDESTYDPASRNKVYFVIPGHNALSNAPYSETGGDVQSSKTSGLDGGQPPIANSARATLAIGLTKRWTGDEQPWCVRPGAIRFNLLRDGQQITGQTATIPSDGTAVSIRFGDGFPKFNPNDGHEYAYSVTEEPSAAYALTGGIDAVSADGALEFTATNKLSTRDLTVTKKWSGDEDFPGYRPASITVKLRAWTDAPGIDAITDTQTLTEANGWGYTWKGAPDKVMSPTDGKVYDMRYQIAELSSNPANRVSVHYQKAGVSEPITGANHELVNVFNTVRYGAEAVWLDASGSPAAANLPASVKVNLKDGAGAIVDSLVLSEGNGWKGMFKRVPKFKRNAAAADAVNLETYTVDEELAGDGAFEQSGAATLKSRGAVTAFVLRNKRKTFMISLKKTWEDGFSLPAAIRVYESDSTSGPWTPVANPAMPMTLRPHEQALIAADPGKFYKIVETMKFDGYIASIEAQGFPVQLPKGNEIILGGAPSGAVCSVTIKNAPSGETGRVSVVKRWTLENGQTVATPPVDSVSYVIRGYTAVGKQAISNPRYTAKGTLTADGDWQGQEHRLPLWYQTEKVIYRLEENGVTANYTSAVEPANGAVLTGQGEARFTITSTNTAKGSFIITTREQGNEKKALPNAVFRLKDRANHLVKFAGNNPYTRSATGGVTNITTNGSGQIRLQGLPVGSYTLEEITPPGGHRIMTAEAAVSVNADGTTVPTDGHVVVENELITGGLRLLAVDGVTGRAIAKGAAFQLLNITNNQPYALHQAAAGRYQAIPAERMAANPGGYNATTTLVTGGDGRLDISGLVAGNYTLVETEPPVGYVCGDKTVWTIAVGAAGSRARSVDFELAGDDWLVVNIPDAKVDIQVDKIWQNSAQSAVRPDTLHFQVFRLGYEVVDGRRTRNLLEGNGHFGEPSGVMAASEQLTPADKGADLWKLTKAGLPKYGQARGKPVEYVYYIQEQTPPGYRALYKNKDENGGERTGTRAYDGDRILNERYGRKIVVVKKWVDLGGNPLAPRADITELDYTIKVKVNGADAPQYDYRGTLRSPGWSDEWFLPVQLANNSVECTITEHFDDEAYTAAVTGPATWTARPLPMRDAASDGQFVAPDGRAQDEFRMLPGETDPDWRELVITNTYNPKTSISGDTVWENSATPGASQVALDLYARYRPLVGGVAAETDDAKEGSETSVSAWNRVDTQRVTGSGLRWPWSFADLPRYALLPNDAGAEPRQVYQVEYSVAERPVAGYLTAYGSDESADRLIGDGTITNSAKAYAFEIRKQWADGADHGGVRVRVDKKDAAGNYAQLSGSPFMVSPGAPVRINGYYGDEFYIREVDEPDYYRASGYDVTGMEHTAGGNGASVVCGRDSAGEHIVEITNIYNGYTSLNVNKVWAGGNVRGLPAQFTVEYLDGDETWKPMPGMSPVKLENSETGWSSGEIDTQLYGTTFRVTEQSVSGYTVTYSTDGVTYAPSAPAVMSIARRAATVWLRNEPMPGTLVVEKAWENDDDNARETRGTISYTLSAQADGVLLPGYPTTHSVSAPTWKNEHANLPAVTPEGDVITYTVEELTRLPGYNQTPAYAGSVNSANLLGGDKTIRMVNTFGEGFSLKLTKNDADGYADGKARVVIEERDGAGWKPLGEYEIGGGEALRVPDLSTKKQYRITERPRGGYVLVSYVIGTGLSQIENANGALVVKGIAGAAYGEVTINCRPNNAKKKLTLQKKYIDYKGVEFEKTAEEIAGLSVGYVVAGSTATHGAIPESAYNKSGRLSAPGWEAEMDLPLWYRGERVKYAVTEESTDAGVTVVDDGREAISGFNLSDAGGVVTFTNQLDDRFNLVIEKNWGDTIAHNPVMVDVYEDETLKEMLTLSSGAAAAVSNARATKQYRVVESPQVMGYGVEYSVSGGTQLSNDETGITVMGGVGADVAVQVKNDPSRDAGEIVVQARWLDGEGNDITAQSDKTPGETVRYTLIGQVGEAAAYGPVHGELKPSEGWSQKHTGLPVWYQGVKVTYVVTETSGDGAEHVYSLKAYDKNNAKLEAGGRQTITITNEYDDRYWLVVETEWSDNRADGASVGVTVVDDGGMPVWRGNVAAGKPSPAIAVRLDHAYTVREDAVRGYTGVYRQMDLKTARVDGGGIVVGVKPLSRGGVVTITNKPVTDEDEIIVRKTWLNKDGNPIAAANWPRDQEVGYTIKGYDDETGAEIPVLAVSGKLTAAAQMASHKLRKYFFGAAVRYVATESYANENYTNTTSAVRLTPEVLASGIVEFVNRQKPASVRVRKVWADASAYAQRLTPRLALKRDGETVGETVRIALPAPDAEGWYEWTDLPRFYGGNAEGEYRYYVVEEPMAGYAVSGSPAAQGETITSTRETVDLLLTKRWNDQNNKWSTRRGVTFTVAASPASALAGGSAPSVTLRGADLMGGAYSHTFKDLPKYAWDGAASVPVTYTLVAPSIAGYETTVVQPDPAAEPLTATVESKLKTCPIGVEQKWLDESDANGKRPPSLQVRLYADGAPVSGAIVTLTAPDWQGVFDGEYPIFKAGAKDETQVSEITYAVRGIQAPDGYTRLEPAQSPAVADGRLCFTLISALSAQGRLVITTRWLFDEGHEHLRPASVTGTLKGMVDDREISSQPFEITRDGERIEWTKTIAGLPMADGEGKPIRYAVYEDEAPLYAHASSFRVKRDDPANIDGGLTCAIVNRLSATDVSFVMRWHDDSAYPENKLPPVRLTVMQDGVPMDPQPAQPSPVYKEGVGYAYTYPLLPAGHAYTIKETALLGYDTAYADRSQTPQPQMPHTLAPPYPLSSDQIENSRKLIDIEVEQKWIDEDNRYNTRGPVTVTLTSMPNIFGDSHPMLALREEPWTGKFEKMPKYAWVGNRFEEIAYTIEETRPPVNGRYAPDVRYSGDDAARLSDGYVQPASGNGYKASVTSRLVSAKLVGEKTWSTAGLLAGASVTPPQSVEITLYRKMGYQKVEAHGVQNPVTTDAKQGWKWSFEGLPGAAGDYYVVETAVDGYRASYPGGLNVVNTLATIAHYVEKDWNGATGEDVPERLQVRLLSEPASVLGAGIVYSLSAGDRDIKDTPWTHVFSGLPTHAYVSGQGMAPVTYRVEEAAPTGYARQTSRAVSARLGGDTVSGTRLSNKRIEKDLQITKRWVDEDNAHNTRPATIWVEIWRRNARMNGGAAALYKLVELAVNRTNEMQSWTILGLPAQTVYGGQWEYTIAERAAFGYQVEAGEGPYALVSTLILTDYSVKVAWVDGGAYQEDHPAPELRLYRAKRADRSDGMKLTDVTCEVAHNDAQGYDAYTFKNLAEDYVGDNGVRRGYHYYVVEVAPQGYSASHSEGSYAQAPGGEVTNTRALTAIPVTKKWADQGNEFGTRAPVTVTLSSAPDVFRGSVPSVTFDGSANTQTQTFKNLPKYVWTADGCELVKYTLHESSPDKLYVMEAEPGELPAGERYAATTTNTLNSVRFAVQKTWRDEGDANALRPASLSVQLYASGAPVPGAVVTLSAANGWKAAFAGVFPLLVNGDATGANRVAYTVRERAEDGQLAGYSLTKNALGAAPNEQGVYVFELESALVGRGDLVVVNHWAGMDGEGAWDDAGYEGMMRPGWDTLRVEVVGVLRGEEGQNDKEVYRKALCLNGPAWTATLTDVPVTEDGKAIEYAISESALNGYVHVQTAHPALNIAGDPDSGMSAHLWNALERTEISVIQAWARPSTTANPWPEPVFELYQVARDGAERKLDAGTQYAVCKGSELGQSVTYTFRGMPKTDPSGNAYTYHVVERPLLDSATGEPLYEILYNNDPDADRALGGDTILNTIVVKNRIGDFVWADDGNGVQDAGEPGLPGVSVELWEKGGAKPIQTTTTDGSGRYSFENLNPDAAYVVKFAKELRTSDEDGRERLYILAEREAAACGADSDADPATGETRAFQVGPTEANLTLDAGYIELTNRIGGHLWIDADADGIQDALEPPVAGETVRLYALNGDGARRYVRSAMTSDAGGYAFRGLHPGVDYVIEIPLAVRVQNEARGVTDVYGLAGRFAGGALGDNGDSNTDPEAGLSDERRVGIDTVDMTIDAGYTMRLQNRIGGFVWYDDNDDGIQSDGEAGIPGRTLVLTCPDDPDFAPRSAVTNDGGRYEFTGLPAYRHYAVEFETAFTGSGGERYALAKTGRAAAAKDSNPNPLTGKTPGVWLERTTEDAAIDAGYVKVQNRIGDRVWIDANNDGIQNEGEPGVNGVLVKLYVLDREGNRTLALAALTRNHEGADGWYQFTDLPPYKHYAVEFEGRIGYGPNNDKCVLTARNVGSAGEDSNPHPPSGLTDNIYLYPRTDDQTIDAGYKRVDGNKIGDPAWIGDGSGAQEPGGPDSRVSR